MPKTKAVGPEPVFTWAFKSSKPRAGGRMITYITQLNADKTLSCDCPGWIFKKKTENRGCKHTKMVEDEAPGIFKAWKKGETLPVMLDEAETVLTADSPAIPKEGTKAKYGRFINLD